MKYKLKLIIFLLSAFVYSTAFAQTYQEEPTDTNEPDNHPPVLISDELTRIVLEAGKSSTWHFTKSDEDNDEGDMNLKLGICPSNTQISFDPRAGILKVTAGVNKRPLYQQCIIDIIVEDSKLNRTVRRVVVTIPSTPNDIATNSSTDNSSYSGSFSSSSSSSSSSIDNSGDGNDSSSQDNSQDNSQNNTQNNTTTQNPTLELNSHSFALWNGYLEMTNILEVFNPGDKSTVTSIELLDINGAIANTISFTLKPQQQRDIILNDLVGFKKDSFGVIKITHDEILEGRMLFYRSISTFSEFEFAFAVPISNPINGRSLTTFNTFQPSLNNMDQNKLVANWLSVVNLEQKAKSFLVSKYSRQGERLSQQELTIPPFGRADVEAGHENPGPNHVGLMEVIPMDFTATYLAQVMRIGYDSSASTPNVEHTFACPLVAKRPSHQTKYAHVSALAGEQTWLEIANTDDSDGAVLINVFDDIGMLTYEKTIYLPALSQTHLPISSYLGDGQWGHVSIASLESTSGKQTNFLAYSMTYGRNEEGSILDLSGAHLATSLGGNLHGSYNLFLNMKNALVVTNVSESARDITIVNENNSAMYTDTLLPRQSKNYSLDDPTLLSTEINSLGIISISTIDSPGIIAEITRKHNAPDKNQFDFITTTQVR